MQIAHATTPSKETAQKVTQPYALILITDEAFKVGFLTTLGSILAGSNLSDFSIYVGNTGAAPLKETWEAAMNLCRRFYFPTERVHQVQVDLAKFMEFAPMQDGSHHSYARYAVASQLEESTILYLDCDTLVIGDLSQLPRALPESAPIAAAQDRYLRTHDKDPYKLNGHSPRPDAPYFNSGIFVLNNKGFDTRHFAQAFARLHAQMTQQTYSDQTYMNILYKDQWAPLPVEWNMLTTSRQPAGLHTGHQPTQILHFVTREKPWNSTHLDLPNIFWHCVAEALGVRVAPARIAEQKAAVDAYLDLSRLQLRFKKFRYQLSRSKQRKMDRVQRLLDLPRDLQIIEDWLQQHGFGPLPKRFQKLIRTK